MIKNLRLRFAFIAVITVCLSQLTACGKRYWEYDSDWVSKTPLIVLRSGGGSGYMIIDDIEYRFNTWQSNDAKEITFCDENNAVIWQADTALKKDKLYLTVTVDNISDYQGATIVLTQKSSR